MEQKANFFGSEDQIEELQTFRILFCVILMAGVLGILKFRKEISQDLSGEEDF